MFENAHLAPHNNALVFINIPKTHPRVMIFYKLHWLDYNKVPCIKKNFASSVLFTFASEFVQLILHLHNIKLN